METPGKRIAKWREYLGKTGREFEALSGIPYSTLKTLETDPKKGKPSFDVLAKLRNAFPQLNIDWLFDEGDTEPMLRENRSLSATPTTSPVPTDPEPPTPAGGLFKSPRTTEEEIAFWREQHRREVEAHERTKQTHERDRDRSHEREIELIKSVGGRKTDASADAADPTDMLPVMVAETNLDYVAAPAAMPARRLGFQFGSLS